MAIYKNDEENVGADGEIALTINEIERLVVIEPDEEKFSSLIARLKGLSEHFHGNVEMHIGEIRDVVEDTIEYYKEKGIRIPDVSFLNDYGK